jgi:hypothetical protein
MIYRSAPPEVSQRPTRSNGYSEDPRRERPLPIAEVQGQIVDKVRDLEARELIDVLAYEYHGGPYENPIRSQRVMLRVALLRQARICLGGRHRA